MLFWQQRKLNIKCKVISASIILHAIFIFALFIKSFLSTQAPMRINKNLLNSIAKIHFLNSIDGKKNHKLTDSAEMMVQSAKSNNLKVVQTKQTKKLLKKKQIKKNTKKQTVLIKKQETKKIEKKLSTKDASLQLKKEKIESKKDKIKPAAIKKEKEAIKIEEKIKSPVIEIKEELKPNLEVQAATEKLNIKLDEKMVEEAIVDNLVIDIRDLEEIGRLCEWERDMQIEMAHKLYIPSGLENHDPLYIKVFIDKLGNPEIIEHSGCKIPVILAAVEQAVLKTTYPQQVWGKYKDFLF